MTTNIMAVMERMMIVILVWAIMMTDYEVMMMMMMMLKMVERMIQMLPSSYHCNCASQLYYPNTIITIIVVVIGSKLLYL